MAPPKPTQPSPQEIIEQAVQTSHLHLDTAMNQTQQQMDERFDKVHSDLAETKQQLGLIHTQMASERQEEDVRYNALMEAIQRVFSQKELQKLAADATMAVSSPGESSGMTENLSFAATATVPIPQNYTPTNTPSRTTVPLPNTPTQPPATVQRTPFPQPEPPPFPPYTLNHSPFPHTQQINIPFTQPISYAHNPTMAPLPPFRTPKLELAMFDGSNPLEWLFQADQFFLFYNLPPENRMSLMSFYMKGDALGWFKWMFQNQLLTDWFSFKRALELRFGPSTYANHQAELFKLKQEGSVTQYQTQFEKLGNQVFGLPPDAILNCFISGLNQEIRNEIAVHRPTNISQAIGLAKLIESKIKESKPKFSKPFTTYTPKSSFPNSTQPTSFQSSLPNKPISTNPPPKLPIKRLSQAQIQERRAQGLCFNCDEKFVVGHKCATNRFLILLAEEEPSDSMVTADCLDSENTTELGDTYFQLSPQALTGQFSPQTLKFQGHIGGLPVMVLIDTGSTHNILQPRIAHHLHLTPTPITQFSVMVGNGSHLQCEGICHDVTLNLNNDLFTLPFYLLPIEGADVVLGMAWLRTLGPIQADFSIPSISFTHNDKPITLKGDPKTRPIHTSFHQLQHLIHANSIASFHLMIMEPLEVPNSTPMATNSISTPNFHSKPELQHLLQTYKNIFQPPKSLPPCRPHDHHITLLPNTPPINVKPYRYPHYQKDAMTSLIQEMLKEGTIIPSSSPFSSPVLLVKKKDGTWRFCVDYRALNAVTIKDRFPIPTIDELLDELNSAKIFTKIDLRSGYHQIRLASEDTHKTAFRTFDGHYEFLVMPFGLKNAPSTFQSAMNDLLRPHLRKFVLVFFDDILIYSPTYTDHLTHLQVVLELLQANSFYAKLSKCVFAVDQIDYLGHVISVGGVAPDPEKVKAILDWPLPRSLTTLRGFLGLTGFYRRFVKNYATLAAPLTDLLRSTKFQWSTEASLAFTSLKHKMTDMPVLALPNFKKTFIVETDASGVSIGAVLSQDGHPIAFFSKKMCPRMQAASVYVREMYAVTEAVKKWRQYLIGQHFHIHTDQKSLRNLLLQKIQTPEQQKWTSKLQGFNFAIFYKPGRSNQVADALSRQFSPDDSLLLTLSSIVPDILLKLQHFYASTIPGQNTVTQLTQSGSNLTSFRFKNGLLIYRDKIFIPDDLGFRSSLLHEYHATPSAGHSGVKATVARVSNSFAWPGLYQDVKDFVKRCSTCQHNKHLTQKKKGLLQPLPVPNNVWEELTMDFITHLPNSFGHTVIWVICDRLTKYVHFLALPTSFTAKDLASRYMVEIFRLHGTPKSIISDRDPLFLSSFWKSFFKAQGTTLKYSTSYHPETDGQTEVVNRSVETYLRCFVGDHPKQWYKFLHLAEFWYNTSYHSAINMPPFKALYGRDPPNITDFINDSSRRDPLEFSWQQHKDILVKLKLNLQKSRKAMEKQANKSRMAYSFQVSDAQEPTNVTTLSIRNSPSDQGGKSQNRAPIGVGVRMKKTPSKVSSDNGLEMEVQRSEEDKGREKAKENQKDDEREKWVVQTNESTYVNNPLSEATSNVKLFTSCDRQVHSAVQPPFAICPTRAPQLKSSQRLSVTHPCASPNITLTEAPFSDSSPSASQGNSWHHPSIFPSPLSSASQSVPLIQIAPIANRITAVSNLQDSKLSLPDSSIETCGPTGFSSHAHSPMNLEDKVLNGPMSIVRKHDRPIRNKTQSVLLKDFYLK
ncbi:uncharacterized protein LOC131614269 [Vicia villosa]|uniref:uncharacterized protein LOC131614269 n=1 Tax=Vicia villosa TaxID=3911 RepID=UPI00273B1A30|nr:uncharacterized protein LOC131614269 [Vicia villosa]